MSSETPAGAPLGGSALKDRVIVVTGASRGLGRAVALALAAEGAHLVLLARTVGALEEVDDLQQKLTGRPAVLVPQDLGEHEAIDRLGAALYQRFGRVDGLVGAAATINMLSPVGHQDPKGWDRVMALNLTANFRLIRSLDPLLRQSDAGRAVFVTDRTGREGDTQGRAYWNPYAASKAALETLITAWAGELGQTRVRANLVAPRPFRSNLRAFCFPGEDAARLPAPEDLAPAVVPLLRPDCDQQGEVVPV